MEKTNPYANSDGSIKNGMQVQFWNWVKEQHDKKMKVLPKKERADLEKAVQNMANKMNS